MYAYRTTAVLKLEDVTFDTGSCGHEHYVAIEYDEGKEMYSAALAAYMSGKPVRIGYTPSTCSDIWGDNSMVRAYSVLMY